jgi:hypothetical protein
MKKFILSTLVGFVALFSSYGFANAQSARLIVNPIQIDNQTASPDASEAILMAPAFPVFVTTGNKELDERRFAEMVNRWNAYFPGQKLDLEIISHLRAGTMKSAGLSLVAPTADPVAIRLLQSENLMRVWGHPEMPILPAVTGENPGLVYQEWLHQVKQWVASSETVQQQAKGLVFKPYPYANNPESDPDYPVFKDTGNPERDAEEYHEQKLRYSEKMIQYFK